jgi:hypothetical protein
MFQLHLEGVSEWRAPVPPVNFGLEEAHLLGQRRGKPLDVRQAFGCRDPRVARCAYCNRSRVVIRQPAESLALLPLPGAHFHVEGLGTRELRTEEWRRVSFR